MELDKQSLIRNTDDHSVSIIESDITRLVELSLRSVRDDLLDNPYIAETLRVLPVGGYRSAIGSLWNAVVDDLRNKIMARSLALFNKAAGVGRDVRSYEDFQNFVNDDQLIDGAYKIGVIGWEASKVLRHAKETRHIFDGHPRSREPSIVKVLAMMDDCVRYVLAEPYPAPIIDIDDYIAILGEQKFDRNPLAVENALGELPELYKEQLVNRLFSAYVHEGAPTILRSNIEFVLPILWQVLPKEVKVQIVRRIDQLIPQGDVATTDQGFAFVRLVDGTPYLSPTARKYKIQPLVQRLKENLDTWRIENEVVGELAPYASVIPVEITPAYVSAIVHTYVGHTGSSMQFSRTNFFADGAALHIPRMMEAFDDRAAEAFIDCIRESSILRHRLRSSAKIRRLRSLANIVLERASKKFPYRDVLEMITSEAREEDFVKEFKLGQIET
jgi:hypothetical protein